MNRRTFITNVGAAALAPLVRVAPASSPLKATSTARRALEPLVRLT